LRSRYIIVTLVAIAVTATTAYYFANVIQYPAKGTTGVVEIYMTTERWRWDPKVISGIDATASSSPQTGVFADTTIRVKTGSTIVIHITNLDSDTAHGFQIDEYQVNAFIPPGETITIRFVADKLGMFIFRCNVLCGVGHPSHVGTLIVGG